METAALQVRSRRNESRFLERAFFWSLALATGIPLIWIGFGVELLHENKRELMTALMPVIAVTGVGHVAATAFFYVDHDFFEIIRQNRRRFFVLPILAAGGCLALYSTSAAAWTFLMAAFLAWQLYHYQRQNYGLIAFAAQSAGLHPLPSELNRMLNLGVGVAVCNMIRRIDLANGFTAVALYDFSVLLFVASTIMLVRVLRAAPRLRTNPFVLAFTLLGWAFFVPTLVSTEELVGFWSYAIAHGAQYLIFMAVVSGNRKRGAFGLAVLVLISAAMYVGFGYLNGSARGPAVYTGLVMSHFLIDAKVWRVREPLQRALIRDRFSFVFG